MGVSLYSLTALLPQHLSVSLISLSFLMTIHIAIVKKSNLVKCSKSKAPTVSSNNLLAALFPSKDQNPFLLKDSTSNTTVT